MGLLKTGVSLSIAIAGGCYEPTLRDCTLTCSTESDCAGGQVCGSDFFCASPEIAGRCSSLPGDAGSNDRDAGVDGAIISDAPPDAAPDARTRATLMISIDGQGQIAMTGIGSCDKAAPQNGMCTFDVPIGMLVTAHATGYPDWGFDRWTTAACATTPIQTCTFTVSDDMPLGVKFRKNMEN